MCDARHVTTHEQLSQTTAISLPTPTHGLPLTLFLDDDSDTDLKIQDEKKQQ